MDQNNVLDLVKLRLQLDSTNDNLILSYIEQTMVRIMGYCNITTLPAELEATVASIVIDLMRAEVPNISAISGAIPAEVKIGDVWIKPNTTVKSVESVMSDYMTEIRPYRKMRW